MLLPHVVDLHPGQLAVLETLLEGAARMVGMDVDLDEAVADHEDEAVAQGEKVLLDGVLLFLGDLALQLHYEFGAITELDIVGADMLPGRCLLDFDPGCLEVKLQLQAVEGIHGAVKDGHEALSAGVDHAGLLEDRQKLRGPGQGFVARGQNGVEKFLQLKAFGGGLAGLLRHHPGDGEDGAFLGLHDRLVGSLHRLGAGFRQDQGVQLLMVADPLGEAANQLREDNAGVAACAL